MTTGQSSKTLPKSWSISPSSGLSIDFFYSAENGLQFVDVHLVGRATKSGNTALDFKSGVVTKAGETWTQSAFFALVNSDIRTLKSVSVGLRGGTSSGSASEFLNGGDLLGTLNRHMPPHHPTWIVKNPATAMANARLNVVVASGAMVDATLRIAAPQRERREHPSSPISTRGKKLTRAADEVFLKLPRGRHRLLLTYLDGTTATIKAAFGSLKLPKNPGPSPLIRITGIHVE